VYLRPGSHCRVAEDGEARAVPACAQLKTNVKQPSRDHDRTLQIESGVMLAVVFVSFTRPWLDRSRYHPASAGRLATL